MNLKRKKMAISVQQYYAAKEKQCYISDLPFLTSKKCMNIHANIYGHLEGK